MSTITFKPGYKYQLKQDYSVRIPICPQADIDTQFIRLDRTGLLWLRSGYAWDGPSGPTVDTADFMRGSLVHDALYQLMRERHLDKQHLREAADRLLREHCREDGMGPLRRWWVYVGVRLGGRRAAESSESKQWRVAP